MKNVILAAFFLLATLTSFAQVTSDNITWTRGAYAIQAVTPVNINSQSSSDGPDKIFENIFESFNNDKHEKDEKDEKDEKPSRNFSKDDIPNVENIQENIKGLFGEKLGGLASELMSELSKEIQDMLSLIHI